MCACCCLPQAPPAPSTALALERPSLVGSRRGGTKLPCTPRVPMSSSATVPLVSRRNDNDSSIHCCSLGAESHRPAPVDVPHCGITAPGVSLPKGPQIPILGVTSTGEPHCTQPVSLCRTPGPTDAGAWGSLWSPLPTIIIPNLIGTTGTQPPSFPSRMLLGALRLHPHHRDVPSAVGCRLSPSLQGCCQPGGTGRQHLTAVPAAALP